MGAGQGGQGVQPRRLLAAPSTCMAAAPHCPTTLLPCSIAAPAPAVEPRARHPAVPHQQRDLPLGGHLPAGPAAAGRSAAAACTNQATDWELKSGIVHAFSSALLPIPCRIPSPCLPPSSTRRSRSRCAWRATWPAHTASASPSTPGAQQWWGLCLPAGARWCGWLFGVKDLHDAGGQYLHGASKLAHSMRQPTKTLPPSLPPATPSLPPATPSPPQPLCEAGRPRRRPGGQVDAGAGGALTGGGGGQMYPFFQWTG